MRKRFLLVFILVFVFSCEKDEPIKLTSNVGILITNAEHDNQAKQLLENAGFLSSHAKIKNSPAIAEIYKFFDTEHDVVNYSMLLPDTSSRYFENLVLSKIGNDFYGFVLRYVYTENYQPGVGFQGTIQRYDLSGELIDEQIITSAGSERQSSNTRAKTNYMYQCVTGYQVECTVTYEVSSATGRPLPESVSKKCVNKATYGWCGDNAGPLPHPTADGGWGTYIPSSSGSGPITPGPFPDNPDANGIVPTLNNKSPIVIVNENPYDIRVANFRLSLTSAESTVLKKTPGLSVHIYAYLESQVDDGQPNATSYSSEATAFAKWAIKFFKDHPETSWQQFENWFLIDREGKDVFEYDAAFWENPNLSFTQQDLPTWTNFDANYPRTNGSQLVPLIGGDVKAAYDKYPELSRGYCALKLSRALNYSGVNIPKITTTAGNPGTVAGADGKYYFLNAKALNKWMRETFGTNPATTGTPLNSNHHHFNGTEGGTNGENFPTLVDGLKGIFSMVSTNSEWASGHADLIEDGECVFGCHFNDDPPAPIDYIDIWVLTD